MEIEDNDRVDQFKQYKDQSVACRLLLNGIDKREDGSLAFSAYKANCLNRLDDIFQRFNIEKRGSLDFKERLKERHLLEVDSQEKFKRYKACESAVVELLVAEWFHGQGEKIVRLGAWEDSTGVDIVSEVHGVKFYTEVKYAAFSPDFYSLYLESKQKGQPVARSVSSLNIVYTYFLIDVLNGLGQLKRKNVSAEQSRIFLVCEKVGFGMYFEVGRLDSWLERFEDWDSPSWATLAKKLKILEQYVNKPVREHLESQLQCLFVGCLDESWELIKVKKIYHEEQRVC